MSRPSPTEPDYGLLADHVVGMRDWVWNAVPNSFGDFCGALPRRLSDGSPSKEGRRNCFDVVRILLLDRALMTDRAGEAVGVPRPKHVSYPTQRLFVNVGKAEQS
jgi:hypothetical protein